MILYHLKILKNGFEAYMKNYLGIVNLQYRDNKIIEVSLRPARGGSYLKSTKK